MKGWRMSVLGGGQEKFVPEIVNLSLARILFLHGDHLLLDVIDKDGLTTIALDIFFS
jgi:hypothetical protein